MILQISLQNKGTQVNETKEHFLFLDVLANTSNRGKEKAFQLPGWLLNYHWVTRANQTDEESSCRQHKRNDRVRKWDR